MTGFFMPLTIGLFSDFQRGAQNVKNAQIIPENNIFAGDHVAVIKLLNNLNDARKKY
jgi:hypothetical protein